MGADDPDVLQFRKNYRRAAREFDVPLLSMPAVLESYPIDEVGNLFLDTIHPNAAGHKLIAQKLTEILAGKIGGEKPL